MMTAQQRRKHHQIVFVTQEILDFINIGTVPHDGVEFFNSFSVNWECHLTNLSVY